MLLQDWRQPGRQQGWDSQLVFALDGHCARFPRLESIELNAPFAFLVGGGGPDHFLVESNIMDDNNYKDMSPWNEGGACKTGFSGRGIVIRNNVARNNNNHGLWFDNGGEDGVFEGNFVFNSMPAAILDEVTPLRPPERTQDGKIQPGKQPTVEEIKAHKKNGSVIRAVARVCVFYRQWSNPHPEKEIESITVSNENGNTDCAFALLGITGARSKDSAAKGDTPFALGYHGDLDATGADGSKPGCTVARAYLDGVEIASKSEKQRPVLVGKMIYPAIPKNGGQPWVGLVEELRVLNRCLPAEEIAKLKP